MGLTWLYVDGTIWKFVVSNNTRNPSIEIIHASANVSYAKVSVSIRLSPELVALPYQASPHMINQAAVLNLY